MGVRGFHPHSDSHVVEEREAVLTSTVGHRHSCLFYLQSAWWGGGGGGELKRIRRAKFRNVTKMNRTLISKFSPFSIHFPLQTPAIVKVIS